MRQLRSRCQQAGSTRRRAWLPIAVACVVSILGAPGHADSGAVEIFSLINERLSYMEDVAAYKLENGKPVEDTDREVIVLEKAKQSAMRAGLNPSSIENFFRTQIAAAKAIQYRYLADRVLAPESARGTPRDLMTEVRPELIRLGDAIVHSIRDFLKAGNQFSDAHLPEFLNAVDVPQLHREEKARLFRSLQEITLSGS
jgi:chorismate mutase